jgi:hypothetical protein
MATLGLIGQTLPRVLELVKLAGSPAPVR